MEWTSSSPPPIPSLIPFHVAPIASDSPPLQVYQHKKKVRQPSVDTNAPDDSFPPLPPSSGEAPPPSLPDDLSIAQRKGLSTATLSDKGLRPTSLFFGIEVIRCKKGISLSQRKYVLYLLSNTGMLASKPIDIPMDPHQRFEVNDGEPLQDVHQYKSLIGKLIHLTVTRYDISYAVGVLSQFMQSPQKAYWDAVVRALRYLKGAPGKWLIYRPNWHMELVDYSDSDRAGSASDRRSITGYCTFVGGNLVTWYSKK
ncbi:uncharacterized mitochondrial protein AtMg00810-like [Macadamia integrifolia]|uniref:uncharacterized mitochondrial protein AtMg00810-like n=1 Tax=Macadamia integrifolia TaxID=60698 RepID=UPI001C4F86A0|nr:uncharacterized mitochondrial protein AtMg00810-like [Macadamia integrifolia]